MSKKQESPKKASEPAVDARYDSKIDAIKDIIFGEDYAALRQSLRDLDAKLDAELSQLHDKLSAVISDVDKTINNRIDNLEMDLKSEIDRLDHHKADRFKLGKMLEEVGKNLQA